MEEVRGRFMSEKIACFSDKCLGNKFGIAEGWRICIDNLGRHSTQTSTTLSAPCSSQEVLFRDVEVHSLIDQICLAIGIGKTKRWVGTIDG
jgi:hypothetical protein